MGAQDENHPPGERLLPPVQRALIVEDDARLRRSLLTALHPWAAEIRASKNATEAKGQIAQFRPELLVLDFMLPDGTAAELLAATVDDLPLPVIVAISAFAEPRDSFHLAELGVRAYLQKPFTLEAFEQALERALAQPPDLKLPARHAVGFVGLKQAEEELRRTMVAEALERAGGSRRGAARILNISRELLQHVIRKLRD